MNMKRLIKASMLLMVATLFAACASEDIAQDKKKENGTEAPKGGVIFAANGPKTSAKRLSIDGEEETADAKTRTNIKHTPGNGADAYWTSDDFIWVKDKNGNWQQSTAITLNDGGASAEFTLPGSMSDYADGCEVRYTGSNSYVGPSAEYVTISNTATCTTPNDFSKAGDWGDCGSGIARNTGNPDKFNFTLEHKSAYLCFLPRCTDAALAPNVKLKSITITATKCYSPGPYGFIADCYDFDGENLSGSPYMLGTKSIVANISDFPLYTTASQTANATYMVVRPDTYDFKIEYTIKDPTTNAEAVVTQTLTNKTFDKGKIYDITADLVPQFNLPKYYMWDAKYDYWYNHLKADGTFDGDYPKNNTDPRWYNDGSGVSVATRSCKDCPNVNEIWWYIKKGDPHWDSQGEANIENGHLQPIAGMWFRKKSAIVAYLKANEGYPSSFSESDLKEGYKTSATATPVDYRPLNSSTYATPTQGRPANTSDYFFLPALGAYLMAGWFVGINNTGYYWSSSKNLLNGNAFRMVLLNTSAGLSSGDLSNGYSVYAAE